MSRSGFLGRYRSALRWTISAEAKAYGFTLLIWATGTLLFYEHGFPRPYEVLLFVSGALSGMALTVLVAFGGRPFAVWRQGEEPRRFAYGAVHIVAVFAGVLAAWGIAAALPRALSFIFTPMLANLVYQGVIALEVTLSLAQAPPESQLAAREAEVSARLSSREAARRRSRRGE